eukprot:9699880-Lingulodinium_polyedra.AAC.1
MSIVDTCARQFWLNASERQGAPTTSRNVLDSSIVSCARSTTRSCQHDPRAWGGLESWARRSRSIFHSIGSRAR